MKKIVINTKAVTLVALVITIIILLILAGTTLGLTLGENGILNRSEYAKQEYLNSKDAESQGLDNLYSQMLIATNDSSQITISVKELKTLISEQIKLEMEQTLSNNIDYTKEENKIVATKNVTIPATSWVYNLQGPEIGAGTWLIFISCIEPSGANWVRVGIGGTACGEAYGEAYKSSISISGYYSGEKTTLTSNVYNGSSANRNYKVTFKALKLSNSY